MSIPIGLSWLSSSISNAVGPIDPYFAFNFAIEIEGLVIGGFQQVEGLAGEVEVDEYREGGVNNYIHKLPRQTTYPVLTLRRGLSDISTLWNWYYNVTQGVIQRKNGTIMLLDSSHIPVMWWTFHNSYPIKWTGPEFRADANEVAIESVELVHEGLVKPLLGQAASLIRGAIKLS